jgi:PAS domain S-box-containing protein
MGPLAARAYLGFGLLLIATHVAVGGRVAIYDALGLSCVGAIAIGAALYRPANWRGWVGIAGSQALFAAGDLSHHEFPPASFPAVPDALYLTGYALLFGALLVSMGRSFDWGDVASHVDAVLVTVAVGIAAWTLFPHQSVHLRFAAAPIVAVAYPLADVLCAGLLYRIALAPGRRGVSYWLVVAAILALFVSDGSYSVSALGSPRHLGSWLDVGWLGGSLLLGAAALHPSMGDLAGSGGGHDRRLVTRFVAGGVALLLLPISALTNWVLRGDVEIVLFGAGGAVVMAAMIVRAVLLVHELDETRRRAEESERKFRMIFERAPIGISVGRNGIMSETNPAFQRLLGYTGDELAQMHYTEVTHPDDRTNMLQAELDAGRRDSFAGEKQYVRKDGVPVETRVHVVLDLDDGLGMSLVEDVTEQRELEAQLVQSQKMEAIGQLAGGIAHDFNNLMTAVIGYSELLERSFEPGDPRLGKLDAIRDSAVRASDLTRQLLAFGRRQVLQPNEIDLRDVVTNMDTLLRRLIGEDVRLEALVGPDPVVVRADHTQLEQVVMNLAVNARDAMPGGGTLAIGVVSEGADAVLTVSDNGTGMNEETQARIFEPFFTTKSLAEGSGLGLSTVHGIVGQSGGTIEVQSGLGAGTEFQVRLPLARVARLPEAAEAATLVD